MKIRADILRTYQSIHTWTGILTGLLLFIAFYAGALTMFKPQITQWAIPSNQHLAQVSSDQLDELVTQAMGQFDKARDGFIISFDENQSPMKWYEHGGGRGFRLDDQLRHASLTESGEITTQMSSTNELGTLIDQLHRTAGIIGKVGHEDLGVIILGVAAILYFLALVSGVIILLPTLVKNLFALRQNKGSSRFWLDSHNLVGIISLPFHLIIAWSVIVFAFHDFFYAGLGVVYGDKPLFERPASSNVEYSVTELPSMETYRQQLSTMTHGYQIVSMAFSNLSTKNPALAVEVKTDGQIMRGGYSDFIYLNPYTFAVQFNTLNQASEGVYGPIVNSLFALHFGNYAGNFGRWLYFAFGLLGAFLFYSGNLLWLEKRRKKQAAQQASTRFMASLTIGVCLGSMLGVSLAILLTKWLYLITHQPNSYYLTCYYVVFFCAIIYSFFRQPALAAIHLLKLLALSCALIPMSTLIFPLLMQIKSTANVGSHLGVVDITALFFAVCFYVSANKVHQRAYSGEPNSIWALS
ncbi:PepSY-associated TM helix domain-containing protein [Shewanella morhuae]|uniref:PepSY-associated TM helix domain-containing protein n=1 Tax=Shewanella morhuae TaxID=365591 RepID=UPI001BBB75AA|nr:PepSY-associated TM helix domain-containing protein [Shewanella morhuae]GIU02240.1 peptidase [Shewanella morhuae]